ncbi:GntR family transcriptional regulator [uncultured Jannaschia sp.]|uniref:GntR family transcriptional regulator n=1 Tax=uncultured Jannaschia sp. TaxID=293347 RepID=UPI002602F4DA|nr:GntR family transcriptional regulator [uncultured Jannaschia sp.]
MATTTQTEHALVTLRQRILGGQYPGGARLFEVALATDLRISRTPIRAALAKLSEEGLLDRQTGGGFSVRRFDLRDVMDTIELRGVLEGTAVRLAAERGAIEGPMTDLRDATSHLDRIVSSGDGGLSEYSRWNAAFHDALARLPGSSVIERELARVTALPFASPSAFLDESLEPADFRHALDVAQTQHRALVEAVEQRQGARAEWIAREHAGQAHRNVARLAGDRASRGTCAPLALVSGR